MIQALISFHPRKRFGQNFLDDARVIDDILMAIAPQPTQHLVEIGPGLGALTFKLLPKVAELDVIEIDRDLVANLEKYKNEKFRIYSADALSFDFQQLISNHEKIRVVGNLPYNISTPLIFHILKFAPMIQDMHFMLQREVVDRMQAKPGTKAYGRLSVMVQYFCKVEGMLRISPEAFFPVPKVNSSFVRITPYENLPYVVDDLNLFSEIVKKAFGQRRKTLRNSLHDYLAHDDFAKLNFDGNLRAEQLSVENFVNLSNYCSRGKANDR